MDFWAVANALAAAGAAVMVVFTDTTLRGLGPVHGE
jgi:hypothetical protein